MKKVILACGMASMCFAGEPSVDGGVIAMNDQSISINPYTGESSVIQRGVVAATIMNVVQMNEILLQEGSLAESEALIEFVSSLVPSFDAVGLFDFFDVSEWVHEGDQLGRVMVAALYVKQHPEKMTPGLRRQFKKVSKKGNSVYRAHVSEVLEK